MGQQLMVLPRVFAAVVVVQLKYQMKKDFSISACNILPPTLPQFFSCSQFL